MVCFMIQDKIMWSYVTKCQTIVIDNLCNTYSEQEADMFTDRHN